MLRVKQEHVFTVNYQQDWGISMSLVVKAIQEKLIRRGYSPGMVDGKYGPKTEKAVLVFESEAKHFANRAETLMALFDGELTLFSGQVEFPKEE